MASRANKTATASPELTVEPGSTLSNLFSSLHIPQADLQCLLHTHEAKLTHLKPGERVRFNLDAHHNLQELDLILKTGTVLHFSKIGHHFTKTTHTPPTKIVLTFKTGKITASLRQSMQKVKLPHTIYQQFIAIFKKQIDFNRQIHPGDRFSVVYETYLSEGRATRTGHIMAAEIKIHHRSYRAVRFESPHYQGYYTPEGESMESLFLDYPLQFKRISSTFNRHRLDPVLHAIHPHLGIDFAAKGGTPIYSIGAGKIVFLGKSRGYGNTVKIQYGPHYEALYGHMKNFAANLKKYQFVSKGQIIGYVGSTGWATGSHLHFSFCVDGVPVDWLHLDHPLSEHIPASSRSLFRKKTRPLLAALAAPETSQNVHEQKKP